MATKKTKTTKAPMDLEQLNQEISKLSDKQDALEEKMYAEMRKAENAVRETFEKKTEALCRKINKLDEQRDQLKHDAEYAKVYAFSRDDAPLTLYKKAYFKVLEDPTDPESEYDTKTCIVKLSVAKGTPRIMGADEADPEDLKSSKIRVAEATVISIKEFDDDYDTCDDEGNRVGKLGKNVKEAYSGNDGTFLYHKGDVVKPKHKFETDEDETCASGIHGFLTIQAAKNY